MNQTGASFDPYVVSNEHIEAPPTSWMGRLKFLGPGFILSASIVGSGELIATTTLGAQAGFITFWVIIVSCLVKVLIQVEFGKHAIHSGESVMSAFDKLPGWRWGRSHWSVWTWLVLMSLKILQVGGIVGIVALVVQIVMPSASLTLLSYGVAVFAALLTFKGYYLFVERFSLVMTALFTIFTLVCIYWLQYTPYAITSAQLWSGLTFELPPELVAVAIGAFGITGVGGDEIIYYNYWCIEKGYAAKVGLRNDSPEWEDRSKGWIRVMYLDAFLAMVIYTLVTAAFYLLGAAILHRIGQVPEGSETVEVLSNIFTESIGTWARPIFLAGSFVVLFSTVFISLASWIRVYADALGKVGLFDFNNQQKRQRVMSILSWFFPIAWATAFLLLKMPVLMVLTGGIVGSFILFIVLYTAIHMRYFRIPAALKPTAGYDFLFWLSALAIGSLGVYSLYQLFT